MPALRYLDYELDIGEAGTKLFNSLTRSSPQGPRTWVTVRSWRDRDPVMELIVTYIHWSVVRDDEGDVESLIAQTLRKNIGLLLRTPEADGASGCHV